MFGFLPIILYNRVGGDLMKILVCKNNPNHNRDTDVILKELMEYYGEVEFTHSSCPDLEEFSPVVLVFPEGAFYGPLEKDRVHDLIHGNIEDLRLGKTELWTEDMDVYQSDPGYRRHVKLFRYQIEKMIESDWRSIRDTIALFRAKYDIEEQELLNPVKVALLGTTKTPNISKVVAYMGKEEVFKRIDKYLSDNKYRI